MSKKEEPELPAFTPPEGTLDRDTLDHCFYLEVIKDKQSIGKQPLSRRGHYIFGRSEQVHVPVIHPSLSRQHAVVLHMMVGKGDEEKKPGVCVMDLGSANATHINGKKIKPKIPYPMKPDYYFCLGKSTRRYYVRHDPSLEKPIIKEKPKKAKPKAKEAPQGVKRKADGTKEKTVVRKLSEDEIKKIQAKKQRLTNPTLGARKLVSSQFRNLVEMPRTAPTGVAVTLEDMASTPVEPEKPIPQEVVEEEEDKELGDDPEEIEEGRSWLIKPDSALPKDEDSD
jgi:pSer/pThr/pTyr-binding forkhead associated (FHA) protein